MPQHESAKKSVRQDKRRTIVNRKRKGVLKSHIKKVLSAIEEKDTEKAKQAFSAAVSLIDKMAAKGLIHKNNAARKKSGLWRKIASLT
jgi:small subunit ribosomal protein S20